MSHLAALVEEDRGLVLVGLDAREQRREVLDRVVRLQVGGLVREVAVADRVRLVERVVGERLDRVEDLLAELRGRGPARRSRRRTSSAPSRSARGSSCRSPCGGCRPPRASSRRAAARHASAAPGRSSARTSGRGSPRGRGAGTTTGLRPFLRSAYSLCQFWAIGPGRYSATSAATSSKAVGASERSSARTGPPSSWNTPTVSPRRSMSNVFGSSSGNVVDVGPVPRSSRSTRSRVISITSRLRRPRKSILRRPRSSTPCISYCVTIGAPSRSPPGSGLRWIGRYSVSGSRVITTAAAWMPSWRRSPSSPRATSMMRLASASVVVELAQLGGHLVAVLLAGYRLEARAQRRVAAHDERRHQLGDLVAVAVRVAEHARRVAHGGPRLDRRERDDLRDVVPAVALGGVLDHLAAVAGVEVHVDVGHLLAARVQEPLEQQVVADRVDVDDAQAVRDARAGRAAPPRTDPDAALARVAHEVPDDEEVRREPHRLDDAELELDALQHVGRGCRPP